jgi:hypothetical protein
MMGLIHHLKQVMNHHQCQGLIGQGNLVGGANQRSGVLGQLTGRRPLHGMIDRTHIGKARRHAKLEAMATK